MSDLTDKMAEALRRIRTASMTTYGWDADCMVDRLQDIAGEALAAYEAAQAEPKQATEPVAWMYELATNVTDDGYDGWTLCLTRYRPNVPEGALRGLTPLFAAPRGTAEEVKADPSQVICPSCSHQFRAIPCDVQRLMLDAGFEPPFVAAPVAQAEARKPLPLKELERLIYEHTKINPNVADDRELLGYIVNAARAIEAAHGIKEKP